MKTNNDSSNPEMDKATEELTQDEMKKGIREQLQELLDEMRDVPESMALLYHDMMADRIAERDALAKRNVWKNVIILALIGILAISNLYHVYNLRKVMSEYEFATVTETIEQDGGGLNAFTYGDDNTQGDLIYGPKDYADDQNSEAEGRTGEVSSDTEAS